jgi:hypothetical protein
VNVTGGENPKLTFMVFKLIMNFGTAEAQGAAFNFDIHHGKIFKIVRSCNSTLLLLFTFSTAVCGVFR